MEITMLLLLQIIWGLIELLLLSWLEIKCGLGADI